MTVDPTAAKPPIQTTVETTAAEALAVADSMMAAIDVVEEIEAVISTLDYDKTAMVSHGAQGYLWKFKYGSVETIVQITGKHDDDIFTVWAQVVDLGTMTESPTNRQSQLFRKALEMNYLGTLDAKFALSGSHLIVTVTRPIADLSPGEISRSITLVATIADDHDEAFKAAIDG
ncbi:MAG: hypothetical protein RLZZ511_354 [Cyanobacteriota bacterium]|jgi:hypothetical protein